MKTTMYCDWGKKKKEPRYVLAILVLPYILAANIGTIIEVNCYLLINSNYCNLGYNCHILQVILHKFSKIVSNHKMIPKLAKVYDLVLFI